MTCLLHTSALVSQESWAVDANGDWGVAASWSPAVVPNGSAVTATLGAVISMPRTVSLITVAPTVGTLFIDNANAYTVQQGGANVLTIATAITITAVNGNGAHVIATPVTISVPIAISQGSTGNFTMSGVISGSGGIVKSGANILVLSAPSNAYTGGTTINTGTIQCGVANTLPSAGTVALGATGTLNLNAFTQTVSAISAVVGASINITGAQLISNTSATTTFSGVMSGTGGSFLLQGTGMLVLDNANTYTGGTTISGGTLQMGTNNALLMTGDMTVTSPGVLDLNNFNQTVGTLSGSGSITFGTGNFVTNPTAGSTYSGAMTGTGSFTKGGASTLVLSGSNGYTGGTNITAGILQMGAINSLPSGGDVAIAGTLDLNNFNQSIGALSGSGNITLGSGILTTTTATSTSYGGVISGTGGLIVAGPGALTLTTQSTFSGGVSINGGSIVCGVANVFNTAGLSEPLVINAPGLFDLNSFDQAIGMLAGNGPISLSATLTTSSSINSTFSGTIGGSGALVKGGTSRLILLGLNTYGGGTTVSAGVLQGNTMSLQGAITNNAMLVFDQPLSATFAGTLEGSGMFIKQNSGNLILTGAQAEGSSFVNGGKLTVNGTYSSPVTVAAGAFLGGTGTIIGNVVINGTMQPGQPGASTGTTTITGSYTQNSGSVLEIEVNGTTSDLVAVTGAVTIDGGIVELEPQPGIYAPSRTYTILSATGTVTGTFPGVTVDNPFFNATLLQTMGPPGSVQLILAIAPFSQVIKGGNAGEVAKCINPSSFSSSPDFLAIIQDLLFSPVPVVRDALDQMQPSALKALVLAAENNLFITRTTISQRLNELYMASCHPDPHHWTMWTNINGGFMEQAHEEDNVGFGATTGSATLGLDRVITKHFTVGVAGAYNYTTLKWERSRGDGSVSSAYVGPYFNWFSNRAFLNLSALAAWNVYHASRHIEFTPINRNADSDHHGFSSLAHIDTGLIVYPGGDVTIRPFVGYDYAFLHENGFTETGAKSLNLDVQSSTSHLWRGEAGFNFAKCVTRGCMKWVSDIKASYVREQRLGGETYTANFVNQSCFFTVTGLHPDRDLFDFAIGVTGYFLDDRLTTSLRYEGEYGHGIMDQTGFLQLVYRF